MVRESVLKQVASMSNGEVFTTKPEQKEKPKPKIRESSVAVDCVAKKLSGPVEKPEEAKKTQNKTKKVRKARNGKNKPVMHTQVGECKPPNDGRSDKDILALVSRIEMLEKEVKGLRESSALMLGGAKKLLLHNCSEPVVQAGKARREADHKHVQAVLRLAGLPATVPYIKCHRVGLWKGGNHLGPRPLLIMFTSTYSRDTLLSRADRVSEGSGGQIRITPDMPQFSRPAAPSTGKRVEFKDPVIRLNKMKDEPIQASTPKPGSVTVRKRQEPTVAAIRAKQQPVGPAIPNLSQIKSPIVKIGKAPQSPLPRKVDKAPQSPLLEKVDKDSLGKKSSEAKDHKDVACGPSEVVTWASIVAGTPPKEAQQSNVVLSPQKDADIDLDLYETVERCPSSTSVLEQDISRRDLTPQGPCELDSKNVMTPRVLRPRVHPA